MSTEKQRKAVERLVGNGGNVTEAMREAGYSENTLHTPSKLTESKGFEELCDKAGLTDDFIMNCLVEDIKDKPKNRCQELNLASKIKGLLVDRGVLDVTFPKPLMEVEEIDISE